MKQKVQAASEHVAKNESAEREYNSQRDALGNSLRKSLQIKAALASFELKIDNANAELDEELKSIQDNFK